MDKSKGKWGNQKKYEAAFHIIFDTKEEGKIEDVLTVLQFLALIKPEKCNIKLKKEEFENYINQTTVK